MDLKSALNNVKEEQNLNSTSHESLVAKSLNLTLRILGNLSQDDPCHWGTPNLVHKLENVRFQLNDANAEVAALTAKVEEQNQEMKELLTGVSETADKIVISGKLKF